jgi:hypothetical protein
MKYVPWALLAISLIVLALRGCEGPADHSAIKHKYDSAAIAGAKLVIRNNVLRSELVTMQVNYRTLQRAANEESDSLEKEVKYARLHPKVVHVIKTVSAVADAFKQDDRMIAFQKGRIRQLERLDLDYKLKDNLFHAGQDSTISNLDYRNQILTQNNAALAKDLKKQSRAFSIGIGAGPGVVIGPDGKATVGLAFTVGVNMRIRRRR